MPEISSFLETLARQADAIWTGGIGGYDVRGIITALLYLAAAFLLCRPIAWVIIAWMRSIAKKFPNEWLNEEMVSALRDPVRAAPLWLGAVLALAAVELPPKLQVAADNLVLSFGAALIFWAILRAMQPLSRHLGTLEGKLTRPMIAWITKGLRALIFFVAVAAILNIWGIQVGPILAGLGLLGAAVALGAQDLFKNLIAGLMLLSEKRFDIGDWILVEGVVEGDVERIGFRSTLIRRFDKAPVYVPNTKLSDDAVINFSRMTYRRLMWTIGLEFRATQEQIDDVCARIRAYIDSNPDFVTPDKANIFVGMDKFSENAVDIQLLCFTHKIRWADFVQVKESLARAVKKIVTDSGTSFAYPSRSVYVESAPADVDPKVLAAAGAG